jgi:hypothetical protein
MSELTEEDILERLESHPDLLGRLKGGDSAVLAELLEATIGVEVKTTTVKLLA